MSEHIVSFGDKDSAEACLMKSAENYGAQVNGEIVRCRDCIYYERDPDLIDPGWPMMCERTGDDMVEPDGYCAWACRKEGGDD